MREAYLQAFHEMTPSAWKHPDMNKPTQECFCMLLMLSNWALPRSLFIVWILMTNWLWYSSNRCLLQRASNSGWHLAQGNSFATLQPSRLRTHLLTTLYLPYTYIPHIYAIWCPASTGKVRRSCWTVNLNH